MKILTSFFFCPPYSLPLSAPDFQEEKNKGTADGTLLMYLIFEFAWNADKGYQISQASGKKTEVFLCLFLLLG